MIKKQLSVSLKISIFRGGSIMALDPRTLFQVKPLLGPRTLFRSTQYSKG